MKKLPIKFISLAVFGDLKVTNLMDFIENVFRFDIIVQVRLIYRNNKIMLIIVVSADFNRPL